MPSRRSDLGERLAERRGLARQHVLGALDERDLAAEAADRLGHLDADRAAAEHEQPARDRLHARRLAVRPDALELAQARDRRDDRSAPVARTTWSAVWRTPSTSTTPVPARRPRAAQQVDAVVGQPALLPGVGVVRDHEVAPGERRLDVDLRASPPRRARRARPRRDAAASWTGCTPSRSIRRRRARARRRRRAGRPRRARRRSARRARRRRSRSRRSRAHVGSSVAGLLRHHVRGVPVGPVRVVPRPVRFSCSPWAAAARRSALARSAVDANAVSAASIRPGSRVVISWSSQPLPSGSLNVAKEP